MTDNRFISRTFTNSNSARFNANSNFVHPNNNNNQYNERDHTRAVIPAVVEDWDLDINENNQINTKQLQSNSQNSNTVPRSLPNRTYLSEKSDLKNNTSSNNNGNYGGRLVYDYAIQTDDVPRLIGRGGETIKQIEKETGVYMKISKDRQNLWTDVTVIGTTEDAIDTAFNRIKRISSTIEVKNRAFESKSFSRTDTTSNQTPFSRLPKSNQFNVNDSNDYRSLKDSNNIRNDTSTCSYSGSRNFNSRAGDFIGSSKHQSANESSSSRWKFTKSSARRCTPGGNEDDDYDEFFGSDEESSHGHNAKQNKYNIASAFLPAASSNSNNTDTVKRVDWAKMRLVDVSNDMTKWKDFPPVIKEFYHELADIAYMSSNDVEALRAEKNNIVVSWFNQAMKADYEQKNNCILSVPNPIYEFDHAFHNYPDIMNEIMKQGFTEPSPIQCQAWPVALKGYDFIGIAQTGTGKTLAFLLPALIHIDNQPRLPIKIQGPKALILSPTRELAIQIHQEVQKYNYRGIRSAVIYGGSSRKNQIFQCESGVEIIIATPGRLNDLVMNNVIDLRSVTFLVLDEADRMLDMGFEPQIVKILLDIRPDRQTIMTSATWPEEVRRIAARYMRNPIQIYIGTLDLNAVHSVRQEIEIVKEDDKFDMLLDFIGRMKAADKMIVFVDRKSSADAIASELIRKRISCQSIHGDREQSDREQALEDLKLGTVNILIATDVASRGLDIQDITVVFNYDLPKSMEDYVHRVGRTGRAGRTGYAVSLVTRDNWGSASRLIKILEEAGQNVPAELYEMAQRFQAMQERKRELNGGRQRFGNRDGERNQRFFDLGSIGSRSEYSGRNPEKMPSMNSAWSFTS